MRCLTDGGTVAAYVWDYAGHTQFMRYFWDAAVALDPGARQQDEGVRFPICRPEPLRDLFAAAGLKDIETAPIDIVTPFADFTDYWTPFLSGIGPAPGYCVSLDEDRPEALRSRLAASLPATRAWAVRGGKRTH